MNTQEVTAEATGTVTEPDLPDGFENMTLQEQWDALGLTLTINATGVVTPPEQET